MINLGKRLIGAVKAAIAIVRGRASPANKTQMAPPSDCIYCHLKLPTIEVKGVPRSMRRGTPVSAPYCLALTLAHSDRSVAPIDGRPAGNRSTAERLGLRGTHDRGTNRFCYSCHTITKGTGVQQE